MNSRPYDAEKRAASARSAARATAHTTSSAMRWRRNKAIQLEASGLTVPEIAGRMGLTRRTVREYLQQKDSIE